MAGTRTGRRSPAVIIPILLLMAVLAGPARADEGDNAHPSGKDRSVEPGGSGTQGASRSNPDGGALDKPGGSGGVDADDRDGNNGCGNDDDFEDDNNGNCGGLGHERRIQARARHEAKRDDGTTADHTTANPTRQPALAETQAESRGGETRGPAPSPEGAVSEPAPTDRVLGMEVVRTPVARAASQPVASVQGSEAGDDRARGALARTGIELTALVSLALAALASGTMLLRQRRRVVA
jgi:hypothetical protein